MLSTTQIPTVYCAGNAALGQARYNERMSNNSEQTDLVTLYNYDEFTGEKVSPWLNFGESPPLGSPGPDFPLWSLDGEETRLSAIWSESVYTIVEFGSFT